MTKSRTTFAFLAAVCLFVPAAGVSAKDTGRTDRGIKISGIGPQSKGSFGVRIHWDQRDLRKSKKNALNVSLVATSDDVGTPVLRRSVTARASQPKRQYTFPLNRAQKRLVKRADGLGVAASQKTQFRDGLYRRAWVSRTGDFPKSVRRQGATLSSAPKCSPLQAGGSFSYCYFGYMDLSNMDLSSATFTDTQFAFSTLQGTNFTGSKLNLAQLSYANLKDTNLSNADLTAAYLYGANLTGATLTGATLDNAQYCNTVMPNGTVNNANC